MPATSAGSDPTKRIVYPGMFLNHSFEFTPKVKSNMCIYFYVFFFETEARPDNQRGTLRIAKPEILVYTRPREIKSKIGLTGQKITCEANYFRLAKRPNWNIYRYRVDFQPEVVSEAGRRHLVGSLREMLGGFLFDGTQIFLTRMLEGVPGEPVQRTTHMRDAPDTPYVVTFRSSGIVSMNEAQSLQVLNLILRRAMDGLHLETVGRNKFDPDAAVRISISMLIFK